MKKIFSLIITSYVLTLTPIVLHAQSQTPAKKQILLIGTFHFNNPNADAVKTVDFDVTTPNVQKELASIADQIAQFKPDRLFVEWEYQDQKRLDSLYHLYQKDDYETYVTKTFKHTRSYDFYAKNEIFQLAFRTARKSNLKNVEGIDYTLPMPFDTVINAIKDAGQTEVMDEISDFISTMEKNANFKRKTMNLTGLLLDLNTLISRKENNRIYTNTLNKAGKLDNFAGAFSVSEWYRRNLYMYALFQKKLLATHEKAVILLGAGHITMFEKFLREDPSFEIIELKEILYK